MYHPILSAFISEKYELGVTTDILLEYEEILKRHMGNELTEYVMQLIENAPNVRWITKYYKWNLIEVDPDDNKFVDCVIACGAKYLVSNDKHFKILTKIAFPKVTLLNAEEFLTVISKISR